MNDSVRIERNKIYKGVEYVSKDNDFFSNFNDKNDLDDFDFGKDDDFFKQDNKEFDDFEGLDFGEDEINNKDGNTRDKVELGNSGNRNGNGNRGGNDEGRGLFRKLMAMIGLSNTDALLYKIVKWGIVAFLILFVGVFLIGYVIIGSIFGGDDSEESENIEEVQEDKTFFEGLNDKIFGVFKGDEEGEENRRETNESKEEGLGGVELEGSYEEDYHELVRNNVFRYKQPMTLNGVTFKILEVEDYQNELLPEDTEREYIRAFFAIKNESDKDIRFNEYDFKLYTKESLESKDTEDKGYVGIDEENKSLNVDIQGINEEIKGLFTQDGLEPTIIRSGDGSTTLGRGVVKPDEVYSAYVVFEVVPDEVREYVLGFDSKDLPMEVLFSTYE